MAERWKLHVIEMWCASGKSWAPTVGVALTTETARQVCARWRKNNPSDKFRISVYQHAKKEAR